LANVKNALLLATSNRSEASVGYATMDGDTCGGISPIGGIDKNFLRQWAKWMGASGPSGLRAFPSFVAVQKQAPTAELRPAQFHQTDEDDLMPYEILDAIERLAIRDKKSPLECWRYLSASGEGKPEDLRKWVARFFKLWSRNQWKRERYAPAFHLDDESLDPKTWCRFPILSGGFEDEIAALEGAEP
jgi:NAD+ synthase (glutamine-hydrolysing)